MTQQAFNSDYGFETTANVASGNVNVTATHGNLVLGDATASAGPGLSSDTSLTFTAYRGSNDQVMTLASAGNLYVPGAIVTAGSAGNISMTGGNITGANVVNANAFVGDGSQLTNLPVTYGNSNVVSLLEDFGSNVISTTGNVSAGYFIATDSSNVLSLTTRNGDSNHSYAQPQIIMGYAGTADYPSFIHTTHNADTPVDNTIEFWTSDGTQAGTFPANAVLGLTVTNGNIETGSISVAGNIDAGTNWINNLSNPVQAQDAATKQYVDNNSAGLNIHDPVLLASTQNLATYTGATVTYNNGSSGVGATLSLVGNTLTTLDGISITGGSTTRLLIKNQANAVQNGIYTYTSNTLLTRATDFDQPSEITGGDYIFVQTGATQASSSWVEQGAVGTVGVGNITFAQFSASQSYSAGNALALNGSQFNTLVDSSTIAINGSNQLSLAPNLTINTSGNITGGNLLTMGIMSSSGNSYQSNVIATGDISAIGNVTGNYFIGNGSQLTGLTSTQITTALGYTPGTGNGTVTSVQGSGTVSGITLTGNVTTAGNLTLGGTLNLTGLSGNISTSGNITGGYIFGNGSQLTGLPASYSNTNVSTFLAAYGSNTISTTGNITSGNLNVTGNTTTGNLSVTGNISGNIVAPGANTQIFFNDSGLANATAGLTFNKTSNAVTMSGNLAVNGGVISTTATTANLFNTTPTTVNIGSGASVGVNIGNASGVVNLSGNVQGNTNGFAIGYRDIPQVTFNANATLAPSDAGKHYYSTSSSSLVLTVPNNASAGFSVGAAINIVNQGTGTITIAQGSGVTMYFAGNSTSGNRTLASYGMATVQKVATDTWFVVGVGVT